MEDREFLKTVGPFSSQSQVGEFKTPERLETLRRLPYEELWETFDKLRSHEAFVQWVVGGHSISRLSYLPVDEHPQLSKLKDEFAKNPTFKNFRRFLALAAYQGNQHGLTEADKLISQLPEDERPGNNSENKLTFLKLFVQGLANACIADNFTRKEYQREGKTYTNQALASLIFLMEGVIKEYETTTEQLQQQKKP